MGNCCGKPSASSSNFQGEGRTLGSKPLQQTPAVTSSEPTRAHLPSNVNQTTTTPPPRRVEDEGPLSAAGQAAQARLAKTSTGTGKLGQQLAEQKKQTRTETLNAASEEERLLRDAQSNAEARNWN